MEWLEMEPLEFEEGVEEENHGTRVAFYLPMKIDLHSLHIFFFFFVTFIRFFPAQPQALLIYLDSTANITLYLHWIS